MNTDTTIPPCFYRVSVKALILDETRTKFLVVQEKNTFWKLPGGGLEWDATPQDDLRREIAEEMGLEVLSVATRPSYFLTLKNGNGTWLANVLYETVLASLDFTPSDECVAVRLVTPDEARALPPICDNIAKLADMFDPLHDQGA